MVTTKVNNDFKSGPTRLSEDELKLMIKISTIYRQICLSCEQYIIFRLLEEFSYVYLANFVLIVWLKLTSSLYDYYKVLVIARRLTMLTIFGTILQIFTYFIKDKYPKIKAGCDILIEDTLRHGEERGKYAWASTSPITLSELEHNKKLDSNHLVGIETNPGPESYKNIISYLKNSERYEPTISQLPRKQSQRHIRRQLDRKLKSKVRTISRIASRDSKYIPEAFSTLNIQKFISSVASSIDRPCSSFIVSQNDSCRLLPEAWTDFEMGQQTKDFLTSTVEKLISALREGLDLKVKMLPGLFSTLESIKTALEEFGGFIYDLFCFVFVSCRDFLADKYQGLLNILFPVRVAESAPMIGLFTTYAYRTYLKQYIREHDFRNLIKTCTDIKSISDTIGDSFTYFLNMIGSCINYVLELFGIAYRIPCSFSGDQKLNELHARFVRLRDWDRSNKDTKGFSFADTAFILQAEVEDYLKCSSLQPYVRTRLDYILSQLKPIVQYVSDFINPDNGTRMEPAGIVVGGPTNVGKSTMTMMVLVAVMSRILDTDTLEQFKRNHNNFVFYRNSLNEYWDGYDRCKYVMVYDDFGQVRDTVSSPNQDALEVIRLINSAPYHMHFAALPQKAKNYAHPKLVYATTNLQKFEYESIINNRAVARRFKVSVVQLPKREYCVEGTSGGELWSRQLDLDKVRQKFPKVAGKPETYFPMDVVEFIDWDYVTGKPATGGRTRTFDELIDFIVTVYKSCSSGAQDMLDTLSYIKDTYIPKSSSPDELESEDADFVDCNLDEKLMTQDTLEEALRRAKDAFGLHAPDGEKYLPEGGAFSSPIDEVIRFTPTAYLNKLHKIPKEDIYFVTEKSRDNFPILEEAITYPPPFKMSPKVKKTLVSIAMIVGSVFAVKKIFSYFQSDSTPIAYEQQSFNTGVKSASVRKNRRLVRSRVKRLVKLEAESGSTANTSYLIALLKRNIYKLTTKGGESVGSCIFIVGSIFVCPAHYDDVIMSRYPDPEEPMIVEFRNPFSNIVSFSIDWNVIEIEVSKIDGDDCVFLKLPANACRAHRDITGAFPSLERMKKDHQFTSLMPVEREGNIIILSPLVKIGTSKTYTTGNSEYKSSYLEYIAPSSFGDCGSPIVTMDATFKTPTILGMHTAGSASFARATESEKWCVGFALTSEYVTEAIEAFNVDSFVEEDEGVEYLPESNIVGFNTLYKLPYNSSTGKTKLRQSKFYGKLWDVTTAPARLNPFYNDGVLLNPKEIARSKYSHHEYYVNNELVEDISHYAANLILNSVRVKPWLPKIYTFEQAVDGIDGQDFVSRVVRNTSPGYPYVTFRSGNKKFWLGDDKFDPTTEGGKQIQDDVFKLISQARRGIRTQVIYIDCLKDERRPLEKVKIGKTRQFMSCPMHYLIAFKMYFGDFIRHICDNRISNGIAVGIDPYSEWDSLGQYMNFDSEAVCTAGDFSSYDGKIRATLELRCLDIIEQFYFNATEEERLVRYVLFQEVINSKHLSDGIVYEYNGGQASGNPITSILNSMVNILMLYTSAWHVLKPKGFTVENLFDGSRVSTFGDDNIISYLSHLFGFDQSTLTRSIKTLFDMDYTMEDKGTVNIDHRKLSEINFLKRGFRKEQNIYVAPLELSVIKETLNWQKSDSNDQEMQLRIEATLYELSLHGKHTFDKYAPLILSMSAQVYGYYPSSNTFNKAIHSASGGLNAVL